MPGKACVGSVLAALLTLLLVSACTTAGVAGHEMTSGTHQHAVAERDPVPVQETPVLDLGGVESLEGIIPRVAGKRVVLVGESHHRLDHHLAQLEMIRRLHAHHPRLAIGMEAFQQPFQGVLDDYIAGRLSERELLRKTEYYKRWRIDFRHYAPILRFAREHRLPVIALNLPVELTRKVGRNGLDSLTADERARVPAEIDRSDTAYESRLMKVYKQHAGSSRKGFGNFLDVQLLWDEGMAKQAADYLMAHPDHSMVVLAGNGHLERGSGIPRRLSRRLQTDVAVVLNGWDGKLEPGLADFILLTKERSLPPAGTLGALLDNEVAVPTVSACLPDSPCLQAGLKRGDLFHSIDDEIVGDMSDLRLMMWDKVPGDAVSLVIHRPRWFSQPQELSYTIRLQ